MFTKESAEELYTQIAREKGRRLPKAGDVYRHFKGHVISVIGLAMHTETEEPLVIYHCSGMITARPLGMFLEPVDKDKYPNEQQVYRLERMFNQSELDSKEFFEIFDDIKAKKSYANPEDLKRYVINHYYK